MHWDILRETPAFEVRRGGRFLLIELRQPHTVLSTSRSNGGLRRDIRFLLNHQSCEATGHHERHEHMTGMGLERYHADVCSQLGLPAGEVVMMGTAANMNYASLVERTAGEVTAMAVVTAGVQGNAACAGDPTVWREAKGGWVKQAAYAGTINTMLLLNRALTEGALAQAAVTMAEGKSAALQQLSVRSLYSQDIATGTTTDQFCIAVLQCDEPSLSSASTGVQLGELIAATVREASLEALRWQNGLEPSYTRSIFHALKPYGLREEGFPDDMRPRLSQRQFELLLANRNSVVHEPLISAAAYAIAAVLDRFRHGTLPAGVANEALRQQAANLAASLAAQPERWPEFYGALSEVNHAEPAQAVLAAIALGWTAKWS